MPVGRLDMATSGLLILTNDTRLSDWLTDPASEVPRVYLVTVEGRVEPGTIATLRRVAFGGLELGTLAPGAWREIAADDLKRAFPGRPQPRKRAPSQK